MRTVEKDVLIVGGGSAGIWLSYELSRLRYRTGLIDQNQLGAFASQRNQGWLHSGALYGAVMNEGANIDFGEGLRELAKECLKSSSKIKQFASRHCKRSVNSKSECMFLYEDLEASEAAADALRSCGLTPSLYDMGLDILEPVLAGSPVRRALMTQDKPMDCHRILAALIRRALYFGAEFATTTDPLTALQISKIDGKWSIAIGSTEFVAPMLVLTVGPLITQMPIAEEIIKREDVTITKAIVGILDRRVCNRILVFRDQETNLLNLSPFPNGTSLNLGTKDAEVYNCASDGQFEDLTTVNAAISEYLPGLRNYLGLRAHFYECHKIKEKMLREGRSSRQPFTRYSSSDKLMYFYPGKFTTTSEGVRSVVATICKEILRPPSVTTYHTTSKGTRRKIEKLLAPSPYLDTPRYAMRTNASGMIELVSQLM